MTFSYQSSEKCHYEVSHLGVFRHKCNWEGCSAAFGQSSKLKDHKLRHQDPAIRCMECDDLLYDNRGLARHNEIYHTAEGSQRRKRKEHRVCKLLEQNDIDFSREHHIDFRCIGEDKDGSFCRIDFIIEIKDEDGLPEGYICLEVDEFQHSHYTVGCELRRMTEFHRSVMAAGLDLPIVFVRYNPDAYKVDGKTRKTTLTVREATLVSLIRNISVDKDQGLGVYYLYYDSDRDQPTISKTQSTTTISKNAYWGVLFKGL